MLDLVFDMLIRAKPEDYHSLAQRLVEQGYPIKIGYDYWPLKTKTEIQQRINEILVEDMRCPVCGKPLPAKRITKRASPLCWEVVKSF